MDNRSKVPTRIPMKRMLSEVDLNAAIVEEPPRKHMPVRRMLSRRSKSCADLTKSQANVKRAPVPKSVTTKPPFFKSTEDVRPGTSKARDAVKLKPVAERLAVAKKKPEKVEAPKANPVKVAKPAPYDYKARYNLLLEKYNKLVETHKELKERVTELESESTELRAFKEKHADCDEIIEQIKAHGAAKYDKLAEIHEELKERAAKLENEVTEYKIFKEKHSDCDVVRNRMETLETEVPLLQTELKTTKKELNDLFIVKEDLTRKKEHFETCYKEEKKLCEDLSKKNHYLQEELMEHTDLRRKLHNSLQDLKGTIRVYCRIRPVSQKEADKVICNFNFMDEASFEIKKCIDNASYNTKCEFTFDKVFTPYATQMEVFEDLAELIQSALDGYNVCVFAYGQTGAGKTYTMQGDNTTAGMGMIPRSIELIFSRIARMELTGWKYEVSASFLEIYNENINDLLNPESGVRYDIFYNEGKGTTVSNLRIEPISSAQELMETMQAAHMNRAVACTNFNEHSSRSHAVTKIILRGKHQDSDVEYAGSVSLVDLAGSESAKTSDRITETKNINKSLSALGSVMLALYNKDPHVPYRNSKLTYLLQSSLGGNSKVLMFVNIAPFDDCYTESINSLRFASKVKEVKISSKKNKVLKTGDSMKVVQ